jgi:hypothetical protein
MASETSEVLSASVRPGSVETFLSVLRRRRSIRTGFMRDQPYRRNFSTRSWKPAGGLRRRVTRSPVHPLVLGDLRTNDAYPNAADLRFASASLIL